MSKAESPDLTGLPEPTHRHPMSGEPIWDAAAVRALVERLEAAERDSKVLQMLAHHCYDVSVKYLKDPNKIRKLTLDVRHTTISNAERSLEYIRRAAEDINFLANMERMT